MRESLKVLEYQLEEGHYVKNGKRNNIKQDRPVIHPVIQKVPKLVTNLPVEKVAPMRKREKKLASKTDVELDTKRTVTGYQDGPWGQDEIDRFIQAIRDYGKDWGKITQHVATRSRS